MSQRSERSSETDSDSKKHGIQVVFSAARITGVKIEQAGRS